MIAYHHSGTCGYTLIKRAWISGCSCIARLACVQICLRKNKNVWVSVAVMLANDRPYESANVVERKSGEYALYRSTSSVASGVIMSETSYDAPVLSNDTYADKGRYAVFKVFVTLKRE